MGSFVGDRGSLRITCKKEVFVSEKDFNVAFVSELLGYAARLRRENYSDSLSSTLLPMWA